MVVADTSVVVVVVVALSPGTVAVPVVVLHIAVDLVVDTDWNDVVTEPLWAD